jgi:hypothetical protein
MCVSGPIHACLRIVRVDTKGNKKRLDTAGVTIGVEMKLALIALLVLLAQTQSKNWKDEPIDVPAIQEDKRWTCADKSNVLMTSEDGKHWCHRVQP